MAVRSILFVPGDSEKKLARSADSSADAIILDLEDSVVPEQKPKAREMVRAALRARKAGRQHWVRINALDSGDALADLAAIVAARPDVVLLPKANGAVDVELLHHYLTALETREGIAVGQIRVAVVATETGASLFGLGSYSPSCPRLAAMTWGAEDLATAVGALSNRDFEGRLTHLYQMARSFCLSAAAAAGVEAIDTALLTLSDTDALRADCEAARRDGFTAKLAIHPDQVPVINAAFTPTIEEVAAARAIRDAFAARPDVGALRLEGRMIDIPHLKQAEKVIALHEQLETR